MFHWFPLYKFNWPGAFLPSPWDRHGVYTIHPPAGLGVVFQSGRCWERPDWFSLSEVLCSLLEFPSWPGFSSIRDALLLGLCYILSLCRCQHRWLLWPREEGSYSSGSLFSWCWLFTVVVYMDWFPLPSRRTRTLFLRSTCLFWYQY
jgi:hypothetical protein